MTPRNAQTHRSHRAKFCYTTTENKNTHLILLLRNKRSNTWCKTKYNRPPTPPPTVSANSYITSSSRRIFALDFTIWLNSPISSRIGFTTYSSHPKRKMPLNYTFQHFFRHKPIPSSNTLDCCFTSWSISKTSGCTWANDDVSRWKRDRIPIHFIWVCVVPNSYSHLISAWKTCHINHLQRIHLISISNLAVSSVTTYLRYTTRCRLGWKPETGFGNEHPRQTSIHHCSSLPFT